MFFTLDNPDELAAAERVAQAAAAGCSVRAR